jgi:hypothetical protein
MGRRLYRTLAERLGLADSRQQALAPMTTALSSAMVNYGGPSGKVGCVPVGYLVSVALVALGTLFALVPLRSLGSLSFRLGLLLNEVPIAGFSWLLIWTSLASVQGDIDPIDLKKVIAWVRGRSSSRTATTTPWCPWTTPGGSPTRCAASPPIRSSMPSFPAPSTPSTCSIPSASRRSSTASKPSPHG